MLVRLYATLRDLLQTNSVVMDVSEPTSLHVLLDCLAVSYPALRGKLWDANGKPVSYVQILLNGRPIQYLQGLDTVVQPTDTLSLFPPVGGG